MGERRDGRLGRLLAGFCLPILGCTPPAPVTVAPEGSFPACEAGALAELRRLDPTTESARLEPLDAARTERRTPAAEPGVGLVIQGRGSSTGGAAGSFRYTCLVGSAGGVLFVLVEPQGAGEVLTECAGRPGGPLSCLRGLFSSSDLALARAEAEAVTAGRRQGGKRAEVDEPAAASIGAWRVYRDAECARRHPKDDTAETACRVELTRARIAELQR